MHELTLGKAALSEMTKSDNVKWFMHKVATTLEEQQFVLWIKNAKYGTFSNLKWFLFRRREASTCVLCDFFLKLVVLISKYRVYTPHPLLRIRTFLAITVIQPQYQKEKSFPSLPMTNLFIFQKKRLKKKRKPKSNWTLCLNQPVSS